MKNMFVYNISELYGKDLIAFGTGHVGKQIISFLAQEANINLCGVTNSRILDDDVGIFEDTDLPLRSIQAWANLFPKATILVTVLNYKLIKEIYTICNNAGFLDVFFISEYFFEKIRQASLTYDLMQGHDTSSYSMDSMHYIMNPFLWLSCIANELRDKHKEAFSEFKSCHRGKSVVVVGTGPSLNYYSQIDNIPHIGVNASILKKELKLDYYFTAHNIPEWFEALKYDNCVKFYGKYTDNELVKYICIPESIVEETNGRRFFSSLLTENINVDIEHYPLMGFYSIIFSAIQFALYTLPKRILLVGCDCSSNGYFHDEDEANFEIGKIKFEANLPVIISGYKKLKRFVDIYYPETEIISVNPVGLRGMFHDVYTESYLEAHPELDCAQCEILDSADFG